jgi:hypothetical protein
VRVLTWGEKWEQVVYYVAAAFAKTHKLNRTHAIASKEKHNTLRFLTTPFHTNTPGAEFKDVPGPSVRDRDRQSSKRRLLTMHSGHRISGVNSRVTFSNTMPRSLTNLTWVPAACSHLRY